MGGYTILLPAKWNPSKERDFPGTDLRYEDNFDAVNNLIVTINPTSKSKITDFGGQEAFLNEFSYLLGNSALSTGFESRSEGGFKANTIAAASILGTNIRKDKLYIVKIQAGDKRWFKGAKVECLGSWDSFTV